VSPFEIYHGVPARNPFAPAIPPVDVDAAMPQANVGDPAACAASVATSVAAFTSVAQTHSDFERKTTAERLNETGRPRTFEIGQRAKAHVPPTHEQILATGRRAKHLLAWRGPCEVIEKLSSTTFAMREVSTRRRFERALVNILPCKAATAPKQPSFDPACSDPLTVDEFIAVRDEPDGPFYIALVKSVTTTAVAAHYYGPVNPDLPKANFLLLPCWHLPNNDLTRRQLLQPPQNVPCSGELEVASLDMLLVARGLLMTASNRLRVKSQRLITPMLDELFLF
jgi:hypothetical protein